MSSMQLALLAGPLDKSQFPRSAARVPVHTCFSPSSDVLGVLWEHGYVEVYHLRTRLGPGRGKVMQPTKIGICSLNETNNHCRQIVILASTCNADSLSFTTLILGSLSESDVVVITQFNGQRITETGAVAMTSRNGRLVRSSTDACVWEAEDGKLFRCSNSSSSNHQDLISFHTLSEY